MKTTSEKVGSQKPNTVLGVDIGSTKIHAAICEIDKLGGLQLKGVGNCTTEGLLKGQIKDSDLFQKSLDRAIKRAEVTAGFIPESVISTVPNYKIGFSQNSGLVTTQNGSGIIDQEDKLRCIKKAQNIVKPSDQNIIHVIPLKYRVDGKEVLNPIGLKGHHLEVDTRFILADQSNIQTVKQHFKTSDYALKGLIYDALSQGHILLSKDDRQSGTLMIDIGGYFTKISHFQNNILSNSYVIPIGGETISSDIATCLKVTLPEAERLKIIYGNTQLSVIDSQETIEIVTEQGKKSIKTRYLCQIIEARVDELFKLIQKQTDTLFNEYKTLVLAGESARLPGLKEYLQSRYAKDIKTTNPKVLEEHTDDPAYSVALGSIIYGLKVGIISYKETSHQRSIKQFFLNLLKK